MKKQIWKFEILQNKITIEMPKDAEILTIQTQNKTVCIWALVDPKNEKELRHFEVYGTRQDIHNNINRKYINTFQLDSGLFVYHVFERL